ncbi:MAG: VOC family protein [Euryarchaeota archaeon]|nr:VOC family protein [Euryarchaeota archaeon]MDE1837887.1 VOC family protein [Euryarchaeota archaeon]MDE2046233.1 VOC family protein [Thermoplasmata archaeon]
MAQARGGLRPAGFDHVDVKVRNLAAARRFFEDGLGMEVIGEGEDHVFLIMGDQVLGLRRSSRGRANDGVDHLALRVPRAQGVLPLLRRKGLPLIGTKRREGSYSWFVRGPEGLKVELIHRPRPHRH